jgi:hypothetical protein
MSFAFTDVKFEGLISSSRLKVTNFNPTNPEAFAFLGRFLFSQCYNSLKHQLLTILAGGRESGVLRNQSVSLCALLFLGDCRAGI